MIPRLLVPRDVRPPSETPVEAPRRLTTLLDERSVVAANLPRGPLETHTSIPTHLPLGVLASRVVVPRDMPVTPFDAAAMHPEYAPATVLDQRFTVPVALPVVELASKAPVAVRDLPDVLDADVLTTGEVNLMVEPVEAPPVNWNWIARTGSVAAHIFLIAFVLLSTRLFPYRPPTESQIDLARQQLNFIYMPSDVRGLAPTPPVRSPALRIDPRVLRQMTPSELQPMPAPKEPERVVREAPTEAPPELPAAPKPQIQPSDKPPDFLRGPVIAEPPVQQPPSNSGLILPKISSPGRALQESASEAMRGGGSNVQGFQGPPGTGGGGGGVGGGGQGLNGAVEMLTPTEGVDFTNYLSRVLASVRRNWYSVMPESARLGDKGRVVLQFRIMRNGAVPDAEPQLMDSSSKDPLDRAALSSIRTSSLFEPLPPAFSGPYIELRFIFLYNMPMSQQ